jgi:putative ABC transport system substrate-binding protein
VAAWPFAAHTQQSAMPVIGYLGATSPTDRPYQEAAFRRGLGEIGYVEGQNVTIEYRWAEGQYNRLPALAADLAHRQVAAISAIGGDNPALATKAATTTIPIVFATASDPVKIGLVASLNRPGGNLTGISFLTVELGAKRLQLLHELLPQANMVAFLVNSNNPNSENQSREMQEAARTLSLQLLVLRVGSGRDIGSALAVLEGRRDTALLVGSDAFLVSQRDQIVTLARQYAVPTIYSRREFPEVGGLMSYGTDLADAYRWVGVYTGRILKGEKPANLPVQQSTKVELVLNLKTAKALGLDVPPTLLARADEVIE